MRLQTLPDFDKWFGALSTKVQGQIDSRLSNIEVYEHFGDFKHLDDGLCELRWKNGRRVYFALTSDGAGKITILILGGNKNGQQKDIKKAKTILKKYTES